MTYSSPLPITVPDVSTKKRGPGADQPLPAKALVTANRLTPLPNPTIFDKNPIESGV
jgi:hypothetical protein